MTQQSGLFFQAFEWNLPADAKHWERLNGAIPELVSYGITALWLPPAYKGTSIQDAGYSTYDLYDVGEFDQKGTVATKYGTAETLKTLIATAHQHGVRVYADVVLNHKAGADEKERFIAVPVNPDDRNEEIGEPREIEAWTHFTFPGRGDTYSDFKWNYNHFNGVDYDESTGETGIFRILGENKGFSAAVDTEFGNYDYLMHANVDTAHPEVRENLFNWGTWYLTRFGFDGMRLDAIKHIDEPFMHEFIEHLHTTVHRDLYVVGEYWTGDLARLRNYLAGVEYHMQLFDVSLHFNFQRAAQEGAHFDLRTIFDDTLVEANPWNVVTFVDNHDTQPGQALESYVDDWFKPHAYALILLRRDGYPCLFYGDYYGIAGGPGRETILNPLLIARRDFAYGEQIDAFEAANCIAFARLGDEAHANSGLVCILSNDAAAEVRLELGAGRAGESWHDLTGNRDETITLDAEGGATFSVHERSVSVWVKKS